MKFGVQYYPEHWPRERWAVDAAMMQRASVNIVRMGEFAWSAYEPREGEIDFSWMDEAIELLAQHGIQTMMCTCSRTPPPWVYANYPSIANIWKNGAASNSDSRYGVSFSDPDFIALSERIDGHIIRHFAGHKNIVAWQVDNEIGSANDCYSAVSQAAFQNYLREQFGTIEALNEAWGSHFWSTTFADFSEIPTPKSHPQLVLAYRRFLSSINVAFTRWRTQLIHELDPGKEVTTNFQNIYASHSDCNDMAEAVDVCGMNHYPSRTPELAIDYYRGKRGTVWVLEQHTRLSGVDTPAGYMRLWAWMAIAHGANAMIYFRWRQCRWGTEQFCDGLLPHGGQENRFYHELSRLGNELQTVGSMIEATQPQANVAVIFSYESRWSVEASGVNKAMNPAMEAADYHKALAEHVTAIDAFDPREDFAGYTLVIAPRLWMVNEDLAARLTAYVESGGTLCLTTGSGVVDECGKSFDTPRPALLTELAGMSVSDLAFEKGLQLPLNGAEHVNLGELNASQCADEIHLAGAEAIATHAGGWRQDMPALTKHRKGKGQVVYVGAGLDQASIDAVVDLLCDISGVQQQYGRPSGIKVYERSGNGQRLLFVLNWADEEQSFNPAQGCAAGDGWRDAFTQEAVSEVMVPSTDLRILFRDE